MNELSESNPEVFSEQQIRAGTYSLLAAWLRFPLAADLLNQLHKIPPPTGEPIDALAVAWADLRAAALKADMAAIDDEYHALFIGVGRGELMPYGSWYLTGYLNEEPLGQLRTTLRELGYQRQDEVTETEDHVAALCEMMALLITDAEHSVAAQRHFFENHIALWMERFFDDLARAKNADFYRSLARLGAEFIKLEKHYLSMLI